MASSYAPVSAAAAGDDAFGEQREFWLVQPSLRLNESQIRVGLRAVEFVLAIVVFAVAVSAADLISMPGWNGFYVLVAALAFVIDLSLVIAYCYADPLAGEDATVVGVTLVELIVTGVWAALWLIAAAVYLGNVNTDITNELDRAQARVAGAFGIISCVAWTGSAVLGYRQYRQGNVMSIGRPSANS